MHITYKTDIIPTVEAIISLYESSGINRPTADRERIANMYAHSNLVITAWNGGELVGIARSLTDFCYCCYLSDLAVGKAYQRAGIGKALVALTKETIGEQTMLLLLAAPAAMDYYPKLQFEKVNNGFVIKRTR
jgi:predicted N-acetyltransferase YhbS